MLKDRKCRGTHKYTFGLGCGAMVPASDREYGLGKQCGCFKKWLQSDRSDEYLNKKIIPRGKKLNDEKQKRKRNEEKSLSQDWSKKLQTEINKIVRKIDSGLPCLARNVLGQMHAGHVYARGGNQTIRYNLHNIHRQSAQSNHFQNDDGKLREGLVSEYGQEYMDFISDLRRTPAIKYTNAEFRKLTEKAREILKRLNKDDRYYTLSERIELRNRCNVELGIYEIEFCRFVS